MNLEFIAFVGAILVVIAYIPQILHLVISRCSCGISIKAWTIWLLAELLILPHTILIGDKVFIFLISAQIIAISFVVIFSYSHQTKACEAHKQKTL